MFDDFFGVFHGDRKPCCGLWKTLIYDFVCPNARIQAAVPKAAGSNLLKKVQSRPKRTNRKPVVTSLPEDPVDRLLVTDLVLIRLGSEIRRQQRLLKEACSEEAWLIYLRLEELINERLFTFADKWVEVPSKKEWCLPRPPNEPSMTRTRGRHRV